MLTQFLVTLCYGVARGHNELMYLGCRGNTLINFALPRTAKYLLPSDVVSITMIHCLTVPNYYQKHCWLIINDVLLYLPKVIYYNVSEVISCVRSIWVRNMTLNKILAINSVQNHLVKRTAHICHCSWAAIQSSYICIHDWQNLEHANLTGPLELTPCQHSRYWWPGT